MKVTEIVVNAGRTLQHPCEQYANIRPQLTIKAELGEGDNVEESVKSLQIKAEQLVEEHSAVLRASLEERQVAEREADEIRRLQSNLQSTTARLEELKQSSEARTEPSWLSFGQSKEESKDHLDDDAPYRVCSECGRQSWSSLPGDACVAIQPDGSTCGGRFY